MMCRCAVSPTGGRRAGGSPCRPVIGSSSGSTAPTALRGSRSETALVLHDYGVSVGQELLARHGDGRLDVALRAVAFLNGGMLPELHRPLAVQRLLAHPVGGPIASRLVSERTFTRGMRRVFARSPTDTELHEHWIGVTAHGGRTGSHRLLRYLAERREHVVEHEAHCVAWRPGEGCGAPPPPAEANRGGRI